jgi:hypothetical protein
MERLDREIAATFALREMWSEFIDLVVTGQTLVVRRSHAIILISLFHGVLNSTPDCVEQGALRIDL